MAIEDEKEKGMSFLDHLEELRWHLIRSVLAILVVAIVAFVNKSFLFGELILGPTRPDFITYRAFCAFDRWVASLNIGWEPNFCINQLGFSLQNLTMSGQFTTHISVSVITGLIVSFPYVFWEIWRFVAPGLHYNERRTTRGAVLFVSLLFLSGILFGYYFLSPLSINFLAGYVVDPSVKNIIDLSSYISTLTMMVLACGIMFQLPAIALVATKVGIVSAGLMRKLRKHAFIVILFIAAILTPSPDAFSMFAMAVPLYLLYEMSIWLAVGVERGKRKAVLLAGEVAPEVGPEL